MFVPTNEVLGGTAARTPEPEAEQNVQGGAENVAQNGAVVSIFVAGEMAPAEYRHVTDRTFCVFGVGYVGYTPSNQNNKHQHDVQFR